MTQTSFDKWLHGVKVAWETKNPRMMSDICAEKIAYFETPFTKPFTTKEEVFKEWENVPNSQKDISFSYNILSISSDQGIAYWSVTFTRVPSLEKVHLEGIFQVMLDEEGLCTEFHQWYNAE